MHLKKIFLNKNCKRCITNYNKAILSIKTHTVPNLYINYQVLFQEQNQILIYSNIHNNYFKISQYLSKYGFRHEILSNCILNSLNSSIDHVHPLLICALIDMLSLNRAKIPLNYVGHLIDKLNQSYSPINPLGHVTNLLLSEISCEDTTGMYNEDLIKQFKELLFNGLTPESEITNYIEIYNILWIIKNNIPYWLRGLEKDEWIINTIKLFGILREELELECNANEEVDRIRQALGALKVAHQSIVTNHLHVPIHIKNTNLLISYPNLGDMYHNSNECTPRYELYINILKTTGWEVVSILPNEWNEVKNEAEKCKRYIKKILLNYYKKFIIS